MDKSFFIFIVLGIGFLYFVTGFVGDIQEEDDNLQNVEYKEKHMYVKYKQFDSIGQEILDLTGESAEIQIKAWEKSKLKKEFLVLFPDFGDMKKFVKERTRGDILQKKLLKTINRVENKYFSGIINAEEAKRAIDLLQ